MVLTGVTLNNIKQFVVNSTVTISAQQLTELGLDAISGDGGSVLNITNEADAPVTFDLSALDFSNFHSVNLDAGVTAIVDQADVASLALITGDGALQASVGTGTLDLSGKQITLEVATSTGDIDAASGGATVVSGDLQNGSEGDDAVYGTHTGDIYDLGAGNDTIQGLAGDDFYVFDMGSGQDHLIDYDATSGNHDTLLMGVGLDASNITLMRDGQNLVIGVVGRADQITVVNQFYNQGLYQIEALKLVNGTITDLTQLTLPATATTLADIQNGTVPTHNPTSGGNTGDALTGSGGVDSLDGGAGDDVLSGDAGNDTYVFATGYGDDRVVDYDPTNGNTDLIRLGTGITANGLTLRQDGQNLVIELASGDSLTVVNQYYNHGLYAVEKLEFSDGSQIDLGSLTPGSTAHSVSDLQTGAADTQTQTGSTGADQVYGSNGADTYDTGAGNDEIQGNGGNDTYVFGTGYGDDRVVDYDASAGNLDVIRLGAGLDFSNVTLRSDGQNLYLELVGHDDSLTVVNQYYNHGIYQVEALQFADGSTVDLAHLNVNNTAMLVADLV